MITDKLTEIYKENDIEEIKADLLNYYQYIGDLPEYEEFKQEMFSFYAWNHLKVKQIKQLYEFIKPRIKHKKLNISAEDLDYFIGKKNSVQSKAIKKCIDNLENNKKHNNLTLHHKREGKTSILTEDIPNTYNVSYYDEDDGLIGTNFCKTVNYKNYRKLERLRHKNFELIGHVRIDDDVKLLNGYSDLMNPKNLHYQSIEWIKNLKQNGHIVAENNAELYAKKLNELKSKCVKTPKKKHLIVYKNNSGKSLKELTEKTNPPKQYNPPKSFINHTIVFENPLFFDLETMEPTEKKTKNTVNLINEFEKFYTENYTYINHINPFYNTKPKNTWQIENTLIALKRKTEWKYTNLTDNNTARILTFNGNWTEYETENYISFLRFFTRWIRKKELIDNIKDFVLKDELKRLNPRGVKLNRLEKTEKAKRYIDKIYRECFNSSILI